MNVNMPTLVTFVAYIALMVVIGLLAYRATHNFSDYILGGRSLGSFVTALSAGASDMSGWLLMGLPGAIFVAGLSESWIAMNKKGVLRETHRMQPKRTDSAGLLHPPF